ncbi:hypothetical protein STSP_70250 [Streptomyces jeddahensis]|uniref:Uncharacterized protein n=1 Tax=Streptomyces jeddahensis TaxID=1716141 RepID=A0A177HH09_9ACTN|nr:hypothetical protein STSP_70250 [Streptomyces jeddahensis]
MSHPRLSVGGRPGERVGVGEQPGAEPGSHRHGDGKGGHAFPGGGQIRAQRSFEEHADKHPGGTEAGGGRQEGGRLHPARAVRERVGERRATEHQHVPHDDPKPSLPQCVHGPTTPDDEQPHLPRTAHGEHNGDVLPGERPTLAEQAGVRRGGKVVGDVLHQESDGPGQRQCRDPAGEPRQALERPALEGKGQLQDRREGGQSQGQRGGIQRRVTGPRSRIEDTGGVDMTDHPLPRHRQGDARCRDQEYVHAC